MVDIFLALDQKLGQPLHSNTRCDCRPLFAKQGRAATTCPLTRSHFFYFSFYSNNFTVYDRKRKMDSIFTDFIVQLHLHFVREFVLRAVCKPWRDAIDDHCSAAGGFKKKLSRKVRWLLKPDIPHGVNRDTITSMCWLKRPLTIMPNLGGVIWGGKNYPVYPLPLNSIGIDDVASALPEQLVLLFPHVKEITSLSIITPAVSRTLDLCDCRLPPYTKIRVMLVSTVMNISQLGETVALGLDENYVYSFPGAEMLPCTAQPGNRFNLATRLGFAVMKDVQCATLGSKLALVNASDLVSATTPLFFHHMKHPAISDRTVKIDNRPTNIIRICEAMLLLSDTIKVARISKACAPDSTWLKSVEWRNMPRLTKILCDTIEIALVIKIIQHSPNLRKVRIKHLTCGGAYLFHPRCIENSRLEEVYIQALGDSHSDTWNWTTLVQMVDRPGLLLRLDLSELGENLLDPIILHTLRSLQSCVELTISAVCQNSLIGIFDLACLVSLKCDAAWGLDEWKLFVIAREKLRKENKDMLHTFYTKQKTPQIQMACKQLEISQLVS
mgnify:CR=1 FL=1